MQRAYILFCCGLLVVMVSNLGFAEKLTLEAITGGVGLSGPSLRQLKLSPDGKRATFLKGKESDNKVYDLWEVDVSSGKTRLLVDSKVLSPKEVELSDEEKARRERQRIAGLSGILSYQWAEDGRKLLFPVNGKLYIYELASKTAVQLDTGEGFVTDPKLSPKGAYVSFIKDRNLWVIDLGTQKAKQLSSDASDTVSNGVAEFIAAEEMSRYTGYFWAPDDSKIAYVRVDESQVPIQKRTEIYADRSEVIEQRYPQAGENNAIVKLAVISAKGGEPKWIDLGKNEDIYLPRVNWTKDAHLTFQRQSRDQKELELIWVDLENGKQKTLLKENNNKWVNLHKNLRFLKNGDFLWTSERSGYQHIYLYDVNGKLKKQLTVGEWMVDEILAVDEDAGIIYFSATKESPLERHIYRVSFDGGTVAKLTKEKGMHNVHFSDNAKVFTHSWSNTTQLPQTDLRDANGNLIKKLLENELNKDHPYYKYWLDHPKKEFGSIKAADGQDLYYSLTKPNDFDPSKKYPVIVYVYGGPTAQLVKKEWSVGIEQYFAQQGYVVFTLDNRGSSRRGFKFASGVYRRMGTLEVADQARGVDFLKTLQFVDADRIGVWGWSYGGYMVLLMLSHHPDLWACGVSVAPVTDWSSYDTHYTERYMDHPKKNSWGYENSSVFSRISGLKNPLLLMHGMADDNVLFKNATELMAKLQEQGKVFETMVYPGEKHGINGKGKRLHVYRTIESFFGRCLKK